MPSDSYDARYDDWPVSGHDGAQFVGVSGPGSMGANAVPVYYDEDEGVLFGAELDEANERINRLQEHEWDLDAFETVGEAIEQVGDELGWDSLSAFAEEHLEEDDA